MCWWLKITQKECSLLGCVLSFCPLSSGNENFFVCFCSFSGEKRRLVCERCLFFVRHSSNLSLMSLSSSIRSSIVSDNKDDNDDDKRGEKELRPPRILAAV